jgi:phage gp29-like protein
MMNPLRKAYISVFGQKNEPSKKEARKRVTAQLDTSVAEDRVKMEMDNLRTAIDNAIDPSNPDRRDLIAIYKNSETDPHVFSQCQVAKSKLLAEPFMVSKGDTESPELTAMLKAPWFEDWLSITLDALMWGHTVVEAGPRNEMGIWDCFRTFPRRHVLPYSKQIILRPGDQSGIPYGDKPAALYLIEIGRPEDLGLLRIISREVIWKNFARTDWSQASEKFGMPFIWLKTGTEDKEELDRLEAMCRNFASNGYMITNLDDSVEIVETAKSDVHRIYQENAKLCDEQISKCINGQTGTSDEKAFVGSAEVHERILDDFHHARLRYASNLTNYSLFPFLQYHGYQLEGAVFRFPRLDIKAEEPEEPGQDPSLETPPAPGTEKKKPQAKLKLPSWVFVMQAQ